MYTVIMLDIHACTLYLQVPYRLYTYLVLYYKHINVATQNCLDFVYGVL